MISSLKSLMKWSVFTVVVAAGIHMTLVSSLPDMIMGQLHKRLSIQGTVNTMQFPERPDASSRVVVRPSPDLIYAICAYDLTDGPLRVIAPVPESYWSLSAFADNTDNYLTINDSQAGGKEIDLILALPGQVPSNPEMLPVIEAKTMTGVLLTRTLVTSEEAFPTLNAMRKQTVCMPYSIEAP